MLPKAYNPEGTEDRIYKMWEDSGVFKADVHSQKELFTISMPPPNATGQLHLGHAVMLALEDIFIRFARMQGKEALWVPGTDHAAIATESLVIRNLQKGGMCDPRTQLGREELVERIAEFVAKSRGTIRGQVRKMGSSCDWSRERYTMDPILNRCVNEVFAKMHADGLIYRGDRIVNWDPKMQTTVSDDEIEWQELTEPFYTFQYGPFQIGTSRPETKFGDKYVVVHPDDKRYAKYKHGQTFTAEWINGPVRATIIKDKAIDPEFGTGAMTITPWHDAADFDIAERHGLEKEQIIDFSGLLLSVAGEFAGLPIEKARPLIVEKLKTKGLLVKTDENYVHNTPVSYRGGGKIEPQIRLQWFIDVNKKVVKWKPKDSDKIQSMSLREIMHEVVHSGQINIIPERFSKVYFHWIDSLRDWCISRQIWWGHRVPVYYCQNCGDAEDKSEKIPNPKFPTSAEAAAGRHIPNKSQVPNPENLQATHYPSDRVSRAGKLQADGSNRLVVSVQPLARCPHCGGPVEQDPDTLDTWFSSALWTWSTLVDPTCASDYSLSLSDLLERSPDFKKFHPTQVMETGYDILFFWVTRMILMTTYTTGRIPFETVYLHGLIRTRDGRKMSKSDPETMIDPLDMIAKYGADALRLSMIVGQSPGADSRLYEEKIAGYRNFVNKLWNASRFVLMQCEQAKIDPHAVNDSQPQSLIDRALLQELFSIRGDVTSRLERYRLSEAGERIYSFVWDYFCDWYLELSKGQKNIPFLVESLRQILVLLHPYCPFVTEELWSSVKGSSDPMLIRYPWPIALSTNPQLMQAHADLQIIIDIITDVRKLRTEHGIEPRMKVDVTIVTSKHSELIESQREHIERLGRVRSLTIQDQSLKSTKDVVSAFLSDVEVHLSLVGAVDLGREKAALMAEQKKLAAYGKSLEAKFGNKAFVAKAPREVVEAERKKLEDVKQGLEKVEERLKGGRYR